MKVLAWSHVFLNFLSMSFALRLNGNDLLIPCDPDPPSPPTLCLQGNDLWNKDEMRDSLPMFAKVYTQRPEMTNEGGVDVNHAFALWFTVQKLKPRYIVESGVFNGQSTWLLRQAAGKNTSIYSFDPSTNAPHYTEDHGSLPGRYFLGKDFVDISRANWDKLIPAEDRSNTLVFLDDHMSAIRRTQELRNFGFIHLWYDDNFSIKSAARRPAGCYSFNAMCSPVIDGTPSVIYKDNFGSLKKEISLEEHNRNVELLRGLLEVYFEFPAIFDQCKPTAADLLQSEKQVTDMGLPQPGGGGYTTAHPPYVKLVPLSHK